MSASADEWRGRATWMALAPAAALVGWAYSRAATDVASRSPYLLLWAGLLLFLLPAGWRMVAAATRREERLALAVALGLLTYLPKFFRNPEQFLFHDELAHGRQVESIADAGRLFETNPILPIVSQFPGLHVLTLAVHQVTGLGTFTSASLLLAVLHALALVGVFVLAEAVWSNARIAGAAVLLYALNPSFAYFDTQFAYESLAVVLFIWVLACLARFLRGDPEDGRWWLGLAFCLGLLCTVSHHLTTYILVAVLVVFSACTWLPRGLGTRPGTRGPVLGLTLGLAAATALWTFLLAPEVGDYLGPRITDGARQLGQIGKGSRDAHRPFTGSGIPGYEQVASFAAPVVIGLAVVAALWLARRRLRGALVALALLGLLYFPSLPLILTEAGSEGARRSWAFSYLGLAAVVASLVVRAVDVRRVTRRAVLLPALAAGIAVLLVGNVAMGLNETYRFPGRYVYGSDTRSTTAELLGVGAHVERAFGPGRRVVADRYVATPLAGFYRQQVSAAGPGFPVWQLYFQTGPPPPALVELLRASRFDLMVVDRQMAAHLPRIGVYFQPDEPEDVQRDTPPPRSALRKWEDSPQVTKVFTTNHFDLYRWNFRDAR